MRLRSLLTSGVDGRCHFAMAFELGTRTESNGVPGYDLHRWSVVCRNENPDRNGRSSLSS